MSDLNNFASNGPPALKKGFHLGEYFVGETIGEGSFGKVKVAKHLPTGIKVAVKILNRKKVKDLKMDQKIKREILNMRRFRHPHIIKLYEVIETPTDIFLAMEYVDGGELFDFIVSRGKLSEDEGRFFFQQIVSAVGYCHAHKVVHRDLKPENLLLDSKSHAVKIADFGLSNFMGDGDFLKTSCGSPNYAAPEVISGKYYAGPEADIWSCGVILYALLSARLPFDDDYIPHLFKKIREGIYIMPNFLTESCQDLIKSMLVVDPLKRITIAEIENHAWFKANLPSYLKNTPAQETSTRLKAKYLDSRALSELMLKYNMTYERLMEELTKEDEPGRPINPLVIAYQIVYDHGGYSQTADVSSVSQSLAEMSTSPPFNMRIEPPAQLKTIHELQHQRSITTSTDSKMWYLGLVSQKKPSEIMTSVFAHLKQLNFVWKVVAPYQLRCRYQEDTKQIVKLAVQLFAIDSNKSEPMYLLDIKKISGEPMLFFDLSAKLMALLKAIL